MLTNPTSNQDSTKIKQNKNRKTKQHIHTHNTKQGNQKHSLSPPISKHDMISYVKSHKGLGHALHQLLIFQMRKQSLRKKKSISSHIAK